MAADSVVGSIGWAWTNSSIAARYMVRWRSWLKSSGLSVVATLAMLPCSSNREPSKDFSASGSAGRLTGVVNWLLRLLVWWWLLLGGQRPSYTPGTCWVKCQYPVSIPLDLNLLKDLQ